MPLTVPPVNEAAPQSNLSVLEQCTGFLPSPALTTYPHRRVESFKNQHSERSSGHARKTFVICGVQGAAHAVDRQEVLILPRKAADDTNQGLPVLLPQKTVDEGVAGGLGIE